MFSSHQQMMTTKLVRPKIPLSNSDLQQLDYRTTPRVFHRKLLTKVVIPAFEEGTGEDSMGGRREY